MNGTLKTILIVVAILVLAGGLFFAGTVYGRAWGFGPAMMFGYGWNGNGGYGPGMMGGGYANGSQSNYSYGPGMMGGPGGGMMGRNGWGTARNSATTTLTVDQAKAAAAKYLASLNNPDLKIAEVMVFDNNAYVAVKESSTGIGAFELLVDPVSQAAYPEYGPNMMWNVKYGGLNHQSMMGGRGGMMGSYGGMMGGWGSQNMTPSNVSPQMPVTKDQAIKNAQTFLDANLAGATAANDPMQFYGYYTLDFEKDGKVAGMLSVNGYSGQIFLHTWHGAFVEEAQVP
jgi:hypothetical protein